MVMHKSFLAAGASAEAIQHSLAVDGQHGVLKIELSPEFSADLAEALRMIAYPRGRGENAYVSAIRRIGNTLIGPGLQSVFDGVRSGASQPTAVLITNLPHEPVLSAPKAGEGARERKASDTSENLTTLIACQFGDPYGAKGEGDTLVNDLIPTEADRHSFTGTGSEACLDFHIEHAGFRRLFGDRDLSPQGLVLTAVCAPDEGAPKTWVANGRLAASLITAAQQATLHEAATRQAIPVRQRRSGRDPFLPAAPIIAGPEGAKSVTGALYGDMLEAVTPEAEEAVTAFKAALKAVGFGLVLRPGTAVYIPNAYTLHARDPFVPTFDYEGRAKRWLQRVFVTGRLDLFGAPTAFAERVFELPKP